jgi:N-succinyldiaminopimelate aminotransferase
VNPGITHLQPYPFERLTHLRKGVTANPALAPIALHIGEPQHPSPQFVLDLLRESEKGYGNYPATKGILELRQAICDWTTRRFSLPAGALDPERHVLPVAGTREALFAIAQLVVERRRGEKVLMPNPFYQIYEGAALLAGAEPVFLNCTPDNGFEPDFDAVPAEVWRDCSLLYTCSPGNPTGRVLGMETLQKLIRLSDQHGFVIAGDECYSEIYPEESRKPTGLLEACAAMGRDFRNCIVFQSLSKRSNLPGLRSGFVAGDPELMEKFLLYRTYQGCALPLPVQKASVAAWRDEAHVAENREAYRRKFEAVLPILAPVMHAPTPDAAFFLWAATPEDDEAFSLRLFRDYNVSVLPGSYLSREADGIVPGRNRIRVSLVAPVAECIEAAHRIRDCLSRMNE